MISKSELKVIETYELYGDRRYRICVKDTNIVVNVSASSESEALEKAVAILLQTGLDSEELEKLRRAVGKKARC